MESALIDQSREEACKAVPGPWRDLPELSGYQWSRSTIGESGCTVYRLYGKGLTSDLYIKHGRGPYADDLSAEAERMRWLAGYAAVPAVLHFARTADEAWLLMTALHGKTAYQLLQAYPEQQFAVVDQLARQLRRIHAIPVRDCPYASDHLSRLDSARARIDVGLVDEEDFDEERAGWTAEQVWNALQELLPQQPDLVVAHGDYSLDNIVFCDGEIEGCIDLGRLGVADRYHDLAILWNCLGEFGAPVQERFLQQYGIAEFDHGRLKFYQLLDELF